MPCSNWQKMTLRSDEYMEEKELLRGVIAEGIAFFAEKLATTDDLLKFLEELNV